MAVALIVAAGSGERLGAGGPKALVPVAGRPMLEWSLSAFSRVAEVTAIVVALPPSAADFPLPSGVTGVAGGVARSASVLAALRAAPAGDQVLVHDAARALVTPEIIRAGLEALAASGADCAIAAAPVTDTIKRFGPAGSGSGFGAGASPGVSSGPVDVIETLDRSELVAVQTPQVFRRDTLLAALTALGVDLLNATDDAGLVERLGGRVIAYPAGAENFKITTPHDLRIAELLLSQR